MFRRLAETFEDGGDPHSRYIQQQTTYYSTLPHMIPSATSGLPGFDKAIQSADPMMGTIQRYAVASPNDIFRPDVSPGLASLATACSSSTVDELIDMNLPSVGMSCGWAYTPPNQNSPYPLVSKGAIGNAQGPMAGMGTPAYKKWFFDLQEAKKVALMDKCKAMRACTDADQDVFQGSCGWCTDTNQGVPIDNVGKPLYTDHRATCSPGSIVTRSASCPAPPSADAGPQPVLDRTCDPVDGRLSANCVYRQVLSAGCTDGGALAIALNTSPSPNNYMASIENGDAVKLYNRTANPPLNLDIFRQGQATIGQILQEVRQLAGNTAQPTNSAIGAAARDLCLQRGAVKGYDVCMNLPDGQQPPFDMACLQQLFLKMGGQPAGTAYPSVQNMPKYNAMGTLGAVKQFWSQLIADMKSAEGFLGGRLGEGFLGGRLGEGFLGSRNGYQAVPKGLREHFGDYNTQRAALQQVLGVSPESMIKRAPYSQGIEVFWFVLKDCNNVIGFLKRTIERDWVQLRPGPSGVSQLGGVAFGSMVQMTDVRVQRDTPTKFGVLVDDGFWIAVNQPADIDKRAMSSCWLGIDEPGLFENLGYQGPTQYNSNAETVFRASTPNIMKMYFEDAGGGWNSLQLSIRPALSPTLYSLTCEPHAPFLTYEVGPKGAWEELRNPGLFGQFMGGYNTDYHTRTDERASVPGKKSFVRLNGGNSYINMPNIAFSGWKTMTFAVRLQSMPVRETLAHIFMGTAGGNVYDPYFAIVATPINGNTAGITISHDFYAGPNGELPIDLATPFRLELGTWYMFVVNNHRTSFDIYCNSIDGFLGQNGSAGKVTLGTSEGKAAWDPNCTWNPTPGLPYSPCNIAFSGGFNRGYWWGVFGSTSFTWDLAWAHFFDKEITKEEIIRECKCDWIYTEFPQTFDKYKTLDG